MQQGLKPAEYMSQSRDERLMHVSQTVVQQACMVLGSLLHECKQAL